MPAEVISDLGSNLTAMRRGLEPNTRANVNAALGGLATLYRAERLTAQEAKARLTAMVDLLLDIPADLLARAVRQAAQQCRFMPTVAEIRERAEPLMTARRIKVRRAELIVQRWNEHQADLERQAAQAAEPTRKLTADELAALQPYVRQAMVRLGMADQATVDSITPADPGPSDGPGDKDGESSRTKEGDE